MVAHAGAAHMKWLNRHLLGVASFYPCDRFQDDGALGCKKCEWNLSAHSDEDIVRVLGQEALDIKNEQCAEVDDATQG